MPIETSTFSAEFNRKELNNTLTFYQLHDLPIVLSRRGFATNNQGKSYNSTA